MVVGRKGGLSALGSSPAVLFKGVDKALRLETDELVQFLVPWLHRALNIC